MNTRPVRRPARRSPAMFAALVALPALVAGIQPGSVVAQTPDGFPAEWEGQFEASARKFVALARAMPAEAYAWRPAEGVMSVAEVYMHVARYNYAYPDQNMGHPAPEGVDYERLQGVVTEKDRVVDILERSMDHVRAVAEAMPVDEWEAPTTLYGRDVPEWAVLLQLVTHMNEHLGQSIAYARMNGVVPPWSR